MPTMQRIGSDLMTLVSRDRAPEHARYDFILNGYRKTMPWPRARRSLFRHNETFNVWTHLIGLVWCVNKLAQTLTIRAVRRTRHAASPSSSRRRAAASRARRRIT